MSEAILNLLLTFGYYGMEVDEPVNRTFMKVRLICGYRTINTAKPGKIDFESLLKMPSHIQILASDKSP